MNCSTVAQALAFEDSTRTIDPTALRDHLRSCPACRAEHFDLAALFSVAPSSASTPRFQAWRLAAAAALLVTAAFALLGPNAPNAPDVPSRRTAWSGVDAPDTRVSFAVATHSTVASSVARAADRRGSVTREIVVHSNGRERAVDRVTRHVERGSPAPR
ncbi:MAG: hypothetical protein JNL94_14730 [Planctomycetes bacterium]|nr:hypothetical protein [Planctomycetota bacterium]